MINLSLWSNDMFLIISCNLVKHTCFSLIGQVWKWTAPWMNWRSFQQQCELLTELNRQKCTRTLWWKPGEEKENVWVKEKPDWNLIPQRGNMEAERHLWMFHCFLSHYLTKMDPNGPQLLNQQTSVDLVWNVPLSKSCRFLVWTRTQNGRNVSVCVCVGSYRGLTPQGGGWWWSGGVICPCGPFPAIVAYWSGERGPSEPARLRV